MKYTLAMLENDCARVREQGATDNTPVKIYNTEIGDYVELGDTLYSTEFGEPLVEIQTEMEADD